MGTRREPRKLVSVPVRIFGTDRNGKVFSENVTTIDVSVNGAKLTGVRAQLKVDEVIGLSYGKNKSQFRIKWTGTPATPAEGTIGLLNLNPERPLWDFLLPHGIDVFQQQRTTERRRWARVKCAVSVELRRPGQAVIWGKASDLSQGGCFVEMSIPLALETRFEIALWLDETKLPLEGQVASVAPGFGNGVRFLNISSASLEHLKRFIQSITPVQRETLAMSKRSGA